MDDGRKRAVSLRLSAADVKRIKRVSQRLGVRDSDVVRYAIKTLLSRLSPLSDPVIRGRSLVPLFLEEGTELVQHFDLDALRLGAIINEGADEEAIVSLNDLHMLAMNGSASALPPRAVAAPPSHGANGYGAAAERQIPVERRVNPVRRYLYDKYLYHSDGETPRPPAVRLTRVSPVTQTVQDEATDESRR